jgi:uncharacterized alkaline shock family protein YloU
MDGKVTISPEVVLQVARITTLATPGVLGLIDAQNKPAPPAGHAAALRHAQRGIEALLEDGRARIRLNVIASAATPLVELGRQIQASVANAMAEIVGIEDTAVDVTFVDVRQTS